MKRNENLLKIKYIKAKERKENKNFFNNTEKLTKN